LQAEFAFRLTDPVIVYVYIDLYTTRINIQDNIISAFTDR